MAKILCALYPDHALIVTSDKDGPGAIMDRDAVVRALDCGQLAGYAGDVWYREPPPA
jgi:formate dehydrogenase